MRAYSATGCFTDSFQNIVLNAVPVAILKPFAQVCQEELAFNLSGGSEQSNLAGTGVYSGVGVSANGQFSPSIAGAGTHNITYTFTTTAGCVSSTNQDIVVNPTPDVSFKDRVVYVKDKESITLNPFIVKGDNLTYSWSPSTYLDNPTSSNPSSRPLDDIVYTVLVKSASGCLDTAKITVNLLREILPPNTFTPNGDGFNDTWEILYFNTYPGATLEVFNRYGNKVFKANATNIPWDGKINGEDLPVGTYYYIIDPKNGAKVITGAVTIIR
jgi:gliding motility-associated-like protein